MNIQTPYTFDELNLMLQEPFALNCRIPPIVQAEIGKRMLRETPVKPVTSGLSAAGAKGAARAAARAKAKRDAMAGSVIDMYQRGAMMKDIQADTGLSPNSIRRILSEANIPLRTNSATDSYRDVMPRAVAMRNAGQPWRAISRALGVSERNLVEYCRMHGGVE